MFRMIGVSSVFSVILSLWLCDISKADFLEECVGRDNMYIASEESCSHYIFCFGDDSFGGTCEDDTPYFSEEDQTCDSNPDVCKSLDEPEQPIRPQDPIQPEEPLGPEEPIRPEEPINPENPTASLAPSSIGPPIFSTAVTQSSSMPTTSSPMSTMALTTSQKPSSVRPSHVPTTTAASNVASTCPLDDDPSKIIFLQHTKSCSEYYMCYHGEPLPMHCSHMLHFDIKTQKCDYPENVKCQVMSKVKNTTPLFNYPNQLYVFFL